MFIQQRLIKKTATSDHKGWQSIFVCVRVCTRVPACTPAPASVRAGARVPVRGERAAPAGAECGGAARCPRPPHLPARPRNGPPLPLLTHLPLGRRLDHFWFLLPELSLFLIFLYRFALPSAMINCLRMKALLYLGCDRETVLRRLPLIFVQPIPDSPVTAPLLLRCGSWSKPGRVCRLS